MNSNSIYEGLIQKYKPCDFSFIPILSLEIRERTFFQYFMSSAKTAIVIYYPVKNLKDWTWNCPDGKSESERCNIDDLANQICIYIEEELKANTLDTKIVPYPQESGLQFRYVALASGYGEIGRNAFYLHPQWGARVHLRVIATELESNLLCSIKDIKNKVCKNCYECIRRCPANAFQNEFNGLQCREFRKKRGEYKPFGKNGILRYCKKCVTVCSAGKE